MPVYHTILVYYIDVVDWQHVIDYLYTALYGLVTRFYIFVVFYTWLKQKLVIKAYTTIQGNVTTLVFAVLRIFNFI